MTEYDAMIIELKKAIMTDGHYILDIVTAAAKQRARLDYVKSRWGLTEEEAVEHESYDSKSQQPFRKRLGKTKRIDA